LNVAVSDTEYYLSELRVAVQRLHNCGAVYRESVPVHERFKGKTVWQGTVEVFDLTGHPKATKCFAWNHKDGKKDQGERFVAVLNIPPVNSARTAVQASILNDPKNTPE
jgi:hypothetical protein